MFEVAQLGCCLCTGHLILLVLFAIMSSWAGKCVSIAGPVQWTTTSSSMRAAETTVSGGTVCLKTNTIAGSQLNWFTQTVKATDDWPLV